NESEKLWAYISENVEKGFIRPSSSSTGAPVLFVKKKDGGLCLCVDYCKLNAVTRKNRYPVPPMNQLLTIFNGSTIFSKIDLCGAYNLLGIKERDEHLTAFRTKYGIYEYLVTLQTGHFTRFLVTFGQCVPRGGVEFISKNPQDFHQVLKQNEFKESRFFSIKVEVFSDLVDQIQKAVWKDKDYEEILKQLSRDTPAGTLSKQLQSVQQVVKEGLESAIKHFKKYADRNRAISPDFPPVDKVWLASKNIKTTRPTEKLSEGWLRPFEVLKKICSHAYHLKLPQQWKSVHPVFHVSLLEPVKQPAIPETSIATTTTSHSGRARRMGSSSGSGLTTQERYIMVSIVVERIE
ncbi:hypothetical protein O181_062764, partial [Austropuccinia psidii MF-1]|nr:hypothetical protein [Austropuccinia psidii MF-1]